MAVNQPKLAGTGHGNAAHGGLVLLINSDAGFLKTYQDLLSAQGYEVVTCTSGAEGIGKVYELAPDVVVTDIVLPGINGYQICRLLKNDPVTQKIPVILVSNFDEKMDRFWGVKAGADLFLHHNELQHRLSKQIKMLLDIYNQVNAADRNREKEQIKNIAKRNGSYDVGARLNQILDKALIESTLMADFRRLTDLVHDVNLINHMLFSLMESVVDYDAAAIFYNDLDRAPRVMSLHIPEGKPLPQAQADEMKAAFFAEIQKTSPLSIKEFDLEVIGETRDDAAPSKFETAYFRSFQLDDQELIGSIALYNTEAMDYGQIFPMKLVMDELNLLMKIRHVYSRAEMLAISDGLTGLLNYRHFMLNAEREFKASKRYDHSLTLAIIDIDNFKQYNEEWGYTLGDEVIKKVAREAQQCFRGVDIVARLAGEEMVIAFPKTSVEEARIPMERFKNRIAGWKQSENLDISVSIGAAGITPEIQSVSDLMKQARGALDDAEHQGGNCVVCK